MSPQLSLVVTHQAKKKIKTTTKTSRGFFFCIFPWSIVRQWNVVHSPFFSHPQTNNGFSFSFSLSTQCTYYFHVKSTSCLFLSTVHFLNNKVYNEPNFELSRKHYMSRFYFQLICFYPVNLNNNKKRAEEKEEKNITIKFQHAHTQR